MKKHHITQAYQDGENIGLYVMDDFGNAVHVTGEAQAVWSHLFVDQMVVTFEEGRLFGEEIMNFVSGHPTFIDAVKELLPSEAPMNPFNIRLVPDDTKLEHLVRYFDHGELFQTVIDTPDFGIAEVWGEGIYGYVLSIFDKRDIAVSFYASPDV